jgi:hypothetical protein
MRFIDVPFGTAIEDVWPDCPVCGEPMNVAFAMEPPTTIEQWNSDLARQRFGSDYCKARIRLLLDK